MSARQLIQDHAARLEALRLGREFYERPVLRVARDCLGKILVHQSEDGLVAGRIVEAEAYRGPDDRASHSYGGQPTKRTAAMFGPAGHAYVFLIYGLHHHFNVVTGREGEPHAVLIRAVEPLHGVELMAHRRGMAATRKELTNGPGKLCQALGINLGHYGHESRKFSLVSSGRTTSSGPPVAPHRRRIRWRLGQTPVALLRARQSLRFRHTRVRFAVTSAAA